MLAGACSLPPLPPPCSLATAATTSSISSKKKIHTSQIKDGFNTSENSSTNQFVHRRRRRRVQHITNQPIHKSIRTSQTKEQGSTKKNSSSLAETQEHQKGRLLRRHSAAASSFFGGRAQLPPPPSAGTPLLPSGATALSPPSLPQAMRARRPDPAVGKPDPVAGRTDPVAGKPDPVAGNAGGAGERRRWPSPHGGAPPLQLRQRRGGRIRPPYGGAPLPPTPVAAWRPDPVVWRSDPASPRQHVTALGWPRARTSLPRPPWVRTACSSTSDGDGRASSIFTRTAPPRR